MRHEQTDHLAAPRSVVVQQKRPKIVVIDDEPAMCALIEDILSEAGYASVAISDPRAALALIRDERPALVLADISMPYMDGYAVLEAMQADPETSSCPVIFITGKMAFSERMQAFRRGVRDYVAKPFTSERLLAKIARVLNEQNGPPLSN